MVEFASVLVTVIDADLTTVDSSVAADREVIWHEWLAIGLQDDVSLEECALRCTTVDLLRLSDHDGLVLEVIEDGDFPDAIVLQAALDNMLFEVTEESQDL